MYRTVAIAVFPENTYWIVLNSRWNVFVFGNFSCLSSGLQNCYYKDQSTVDMIKKNVAQTSDLWSSLSQFDGNTIYDGVEHIILLLNNSLVAIEKCRI